MQNRKQQSGIDSAHDTSAFSCGLFVTVGAVLAGSALSLLPGKGMSRTVFPGAERIALAVMVLGFSGVLVTTMLNLPDTTRRTLGVLFAAALLCSGFVALVVWFAVSGASDE
jgi:cytochrome bd-type quinol oxidase subunit 2